MTVDKLTILCFIVLICLVSNAGATWIPLGAAICGDVGNNNPVAATRSRDGFIYMAVGSTSSETKGKVQLYKFDEASCSLSPELLPVVRESTSRSLGYSVALSCDANTMAVSDRHSERFVQVYERQDGKNEWTKKGQEIATLENWSDEESYGFGTYTQLSCDGGTLVIHTYYYSTVHVFKFDANLQEWRKVPIPILDFFTGMINSAQSKSMADFAIDTDPLRLAGLHGSKPQIFEIRDETMEQLRGDFDDFTMARQPREMHITPSGNHIVVRRSFGLFYGEGFVVFEFDVPTAEWKQVGNAITVTDLLEVSIWRDGSRITTVQHNFRDGIRIGIYELNGTDWELVGQEVGIDLGIEFDPSVYRMVDSVVLFEYYISEREMVIQGYFYSEDGSIDCPSNLNDTEAVVCHQDESDPIFVDMTIAPTKTPVVIVSGTSDAKKEDTYERSGAVSAWSVTWTTCLGIVAGVPVLGYVVWWPSFHGT